MSVLHDEKAIDQVYESRREISRALALQWFTQYVFPKTWTDTWLTVGLAYYLSGLFIRRHFGNGEYRLRMKKDMELLTELDFQQQPLYPGNPATCGVFEDLTKNELLQLKAPLVIAMLERFMGKNILQKVTGLLNYHFKCHVKMCDRL